MIGKKILASIFLMLLMGITGAQTASNSVLTQDCQDDGSFVAFVCNLKETLLMVGPMVSVIGLVVGGVIYVYSIVFVTAEARGRYQTLSMNLVIGAIILAALVGGAVAIYEATSGILIPPA
jgi:hypothetical protein